MLLEAYLGSTTMLSEQISKATTANMDYAKMLQQMCHKIVAKYENCVWLAFRLSQIIYRNFDCQLKLQQLLNINNVRHCL